MVVFQEAHACMCMLNHFSCVRFFATLWTVVCQAPLAMRFSRQGYWSGLPCPPPGFELASLSSPVLGGVFFTTSITWEALQEAKYFPFSLWKGHVSIHAFPAAAWDSDFPSACIQGWMGSFPGDTKESCHTLNYWESLKKKNKDSLDIHRGLRDNRELGWANWRGSSTQNQSVKTGRNSCFIWCTETNTFSPEFLSA